MKRLALSLIIFATAFGCTKKSDPAADYVNRLSNVLGVERALEKQSILLNYPAPRQLKIIEQVKQISIREFLSLRQCELHRVLARRNSQLGKVASASQTLLNDIDVLLSGPDCVDTLIKNNQLALATVLQNHLDAKLETIMRSTWSAILGGPENASFWSHRETPENYPRTIEQPQSAALLAIEKFLQSMLENDMSTAASQAKELEKNLAVLRFGDGGTLLKEISRLTMSLRTANQILQKGLDRPLCFNRRITPAARNLENVVNKFFIPKVQGSAVLLSQRFSQLMPAYTRIELLLDDASPDPYKVWQKQRDRLFTDGLAATKIHVSLLQEIYAQCGLTAGNRVL